MNLDTLAATEVMGWPVIDTLAPVPKGGYVRLQCAYFGSDHPDRCGIFQPSTNIAHAHMLRDKVLEKHPEWRVVSVASRHTFPEKGMWFYADVKDVTGRFISESGTHSTEPAALCLALLRATGVPEDQIKEAMDGK